MTIAANGQRVGAAAPSFRSVACVQFWTCSNDGRRFDLMIVGPIAGETFCGVLGRVTDGWLVVNGFNRQSHLFQPDGPLAWWYVGEKLDIPQRDDAETVTAIIAAAMGREAILG